MKKTVLTAGGVTFAAMIFLGIMYTKLHSGVLLSLAITAGVTAYHIWMRLVVGGLYHRFFRYPDYRKKWYQLHVWEEKWYQFLQIKKWKGQMPTWRPQDFDIRRHTPEEIVGTMCQSEVGHETIFALSFLPLFSSCWFDSFWVFFITSVVTAACCDLPFIMMQRYNRNRLVKVLQKSKNRKQER